MERTALRDDAHGIRRTAVGDSFGVEASALTTAAARGVPGRTDHTSGSCSGEADGDGVGAVSEPLDSKAVVGSIHELSERPSEISSIKL